MRRFLYLMSRFLRRLDVYGPRVLRCLGETIVNTPRYIKQMRIAKKQILANAKKAAQDKGKRILILAYENMHHNIVFDMMQMCNYNNNYVEIFTNELAKKEFESLLGEDAGKMHWVVTPNNSLYHVNKFFYKSISKFATAVMLKMAMEKIRYWDTIIIPNGYQYNFMIHEPFLCDGNSADIITTVHNVNNFFAKDKYTNTDAYAVLMEEVRLEILRRKLTDKKIYTFPPIFRESQKHIKNTNNEKVLFVVAGNVDSGRKNYTLVAEVFSGLNDYYDKLELVLLGRSNTDYGRRIAGLCKKMQERGLVVTTYDDFVPSDLFNLTMEKADYILAPINVKRHIPSTGISEIYGKTQATGSILDAINHAKPIIVPLEFTVEENMRSSAITYTDVENLKNIIIQLLDRETLRKYTAEALVNSRKYALENIGFYKEMSK